MGLLETSIQDSILKIQFRDPVSRNSFSIRAAEEFQEAFRTSVDSYKAILFFSSGRVFCSGGNLADYAAMTSSNQGRDVNRRISLILDEFSRLCVPTVAVVQGDCFGGGLELLSAFDTVLAAPHSLFGFWQRKVALTFGWGGGRRIEKRIGEKKLTQLAISAATFGAQEAHRIGLIDRVCVEPLLMQEALKHIRQTTQLPNGPVPFLKTWDALMEQNSFESLWWGEEHLAILNARSSRKNK